MVQTSSPGSQKIIAAFLASVIDRVINIGSLKNGNHVFVVQEDIHQVVEEAHAAGALVKVIIEACPLTNEEKISTYRLAQATGADFVKTSTRFSIVGATLTDVTLMRQMIGPRMGLKAAGGIRTHADAEALLNAGTTRLRASAGVEIIQGEAQAGGRN